MTEIWQAKSYKLMFIDISIAHFHSPSRRRVFVELPPERARSGWCGPLPKSVHGTRDAVANFAAIGMDTVTNMKFEDGKFNPCLCKHASKHIRLFYNGDDFVILEGEKDLQWFAKELNEAWIVKVRGVLSGNEGGLKDIALSNRFVRCRQTMNGWPFLEWEADPRHVEIMTETLGLRRAEATKTLSSPAIESCVDEVNNATDFSEHHARTYRGVCVIINDLARDRPDILFAAKGMARWMSQPNVMTWEMAKSCGTCWARREWWVDS